jgi:hypothetical protein
VRRRVDGSDDDLVDVVAPLLYCRQRSVWGWRIVEKLASNDQRGFSGRSQRWSHIRCGRVLAMRHGCGVDDSCADSATADTPRLSHPGAGSDLSLSPLLLASWVR